MASKKGRKHRNTAVEHTNEKNETSAFNLSSLLTILKWE
jgi:hypothetical protein